MSPIGFSRIRQILMATIHPLVTGRAAETSHPAISAAAAGMMPEDTMVAGIDRAYLSFRLIQLIAWGTNHGLPQ